jgi:hypothetical protein
MNSTLEATKPGSVRPSTTQSCAASGCWHHAQWQPGQGEMPPQAARAEGTPKNADAPMNQSREAHHPARPHHSPRGAMTA